MCYVCVNSSTFIRFGESSFFDRFIRYITGSFATEFELQQVCCLCFSRPHPLYATPIVDIATAMIAPLQLVDLFAEYPDAGSATRGFRQAIEVIRGNIAWLDRYKNME